MLEEIEDLEGLLGQARDLERWRGDGYLLGEDYQEFQAGVEGLLRRVWGRYEYGGGDAGWEWLVQMRLVMLGMMELLMAVQEGLRGEEDEEGPFGMEAVLASLPEEARMRFARLLDRLIYLLRDIPDVVKWEGKIC